MLQTVKLHVALPYFSWSAILFLSQCRIASIARFWSSESDDESSLWLLCASPDRPTLHYSKVCTIAIPLI